MRYNGAMKKLQQLLSSKSIGELFEAVHVMIALVDQDGVLISWNQAFEEYKQTEKLEDIFSQADRHHVGLKLSINSREHWLAELPASEGGLATFCDCVFLPASNGQFLFVAQKIESHPSLQKLVDRLNMRVKMYKRESEAAKKMARNKQVEMESVMVQASEVAQIDALTFLLNRRMIVKELQSEVIRAGRYESPLSISVMDIDHFKSVNDTYGHLAGDEVLRQVAYQLKEHIRQPDMAGRYGGEEFLIILPNSDLKAASEQAARLCREISEIEVFTHEHMIKVTVSLGVAQFRPGVDTWDSLLNRADNAMYEAKRGGRNRWVADE